MEGSGGAIWVSQASLKPVWFLNSGDLIPLLTVFIDIPFWAEIPHSLRNACEISFSLEVLITGWLHCHSQLRECPLEPEGSPLNPAQVSDNAQWVENTVWLQAEPHLSTGNSREVDESEARCRWIWIWDVNLPSWSSCSCLGTDTGTRHLKRISYSSEQVGWGPWALNAGRARCLPWQSWLANPADALGHSGNNVSVGKNGAGNCSLRGPLHQFCLNARS